MKRPHIYLAAIVETVVAFALAIAACAVVSAFCSCSRKVYVPVETTVAQTDTFYSAKVRVDSVIFRDSVTVIQKGDTVFLTRYRDRYRIRERTDTVYQSMIDSVRVAAPYPVERELTRWEKAKMDFGGFAIGAVAALFAAVIALLVWLIRIKRRR